MTEIIYKVYEKILKRREKELSLRKLEKLIFLMEK